MKKLFLSLVKNIFLQILSFSIIVGMIAFASTTWPSSAPSGETTGGIFMTYFNSIKVACPTGKYLQGYDTNYTKICATAPIGPKGDTGATGAKGDTGARGANGTNGTNGTNATFDASNTLDLYYCPCNNMGRTSGSEQLEYANMINMGVVSQFSNTLGPSGLSIVSTCAYYNGNIGDAGTMQELNCTKIGKILK